MTGGPLTLDDIVDQRAYERERDAFRRDVIALKKLRRIAVGPVVALTFESRATVRFQVQEMARAERISTDAGIQHELDVYNRLLPGPGELSATLFLELVTEEDLQTWLPRLVGVERSCALVLGAGPDAHVVPSVAEEKHGHRLSRSHATCAVHYVRFAVAPDQVAALSTGPVSLVVDHPEYPGGRPGTVLSDATRAELIGDLVGP